MESLPTVLLDQGLPRDAAGQLRRMGVNCTHAGEAGMSTATDTELLEWARVHNAVVVTLDADFHAILAVTCAVTPSVIRVRLQGLNGPALAKLVGETIERHAREIVVGCMITVKHRKTTCHILGSSM